MTPKPIRAKRRKAHRPILAREQYDAALNADGLRWQPVWVLPRAAEDYERMVEQAASMIFVPLDSPKGETDRIARAVLASLGITPPKSTPKP